MATPAAGEEKTLVTAGMICMVLLPPVGLLLGVILMLKPGRVEDGLLIASVSIALLVLGYYLVA